MLKLRNTGLSYLPKFPELIMHAAGIKINYKKLGSIACSVNKQAWTL